MSAYRPAMSRATGASPRPGTGAIPAGMHRVQVVGRVQAARDVVTLWLAVPGTLRAPAPYQPGQFITLALATDRGTLYRSYSLCGDGSHDRPWEITIKRQHAGVVSSYMYDRVAPGQILYVNGPAGSFTLPQRLRPGAPLVFIALGSGITPIYGMLRALARLAPERRPRVQLHYAYSSPADAIYARELAQLDPQREWLAQYHYISSRGSRLTPEYVLRLAGDETQAAEWYICGSGEFKRAMEGALTRRGVASAQIHAEMFASPGASASMSGTFSGTMLGVSETGHARAAGGATIRLADEDRVLAARPGETLLETLERGGYHPAFSCRAGACGTCRLRLLAGQVTSDGDGMLTPQERAAGYVLSCVARPVGEVTLASASASGAASGGSVGGHRTGTARPAARILLRSTLIAASLVLFVRAWTLTSQPIAAQAASPSTTQPSDPTACQSGKHHDDGDNEGHDDDHNAACVSPTPTPSGPSGASGVWTQPAVPTTPPSTSSGASR